MEPELWVIEGRQLWGREIWVIEGKQRRPRLEQPVVRWFR
jgi:hypothetical protein